MSDWRFSIDGPAWSSAVAAAPTEDTKRAFWQQAVPALATHEAPAPPKPCIVIAHVTALGAWGNPPGGPHGRAKGLLDALHDDRKSGPWYRDLGHRAPLTDDHPGHVCGLAIEVRPGESHTRYLLGADLDIHGELLASVAVDLEAPNDIAGTRPEQQRIAVARGAFGAAVREAFNQYAYVVNHSPAALVVRHHAQRDEDNTWATWIAAICGTQRQPAGHWATGAPLAGWSPTSIASLADPGLLSPVTYEVWG